jgi:hypothetical protein
MTTAKDISDQLALIACHNVIQEAAEMLAARTISDEDAATFEVIGAEKFLCHGDGKYATRDERHSYERWQCCRDVLGDAGSADRLSLVDCIRWMTTEQVEPGEDCITFEQVMSTVAGAIREPYASRAGAIAGAIAPVQHSSGSHGSHFF